MILFHICRSPCPRPRTFMIECPFGLVRQLLYDNQLSSCCAPTYVLPFKVTTRYIALGGVTSTKLDTFLPIFAHFCQFEAKTV